MLMKKTNEIIESDLCPYTGLKITKQVDWSNLTFGSDEYELTIVKVGSNFLYVKTWGYSSLETVIGYVNLVNTIVNKFINPDEQFVLLEDYTHHSGASISGKNYYIKNLIKNPRLGGIVFIDSPAVLRTIIRLGKRIYRPAFPVNMAKDYQIAISLALHSFTQDRGKKFNFLNKTPPTWKGNFGDCNIQLKLLNDYILFYKISGHLKIDNFQAIWDLFEKVMSESGLAKGGQYFLVSDWSEYKGSSFRIKSEMQKKTEHFLSKYPCEVSFIFGLSFFTKRFVKFFRSKIATPMELVKDQDEAIAIILNIRQNKNYSRKTYKDKKIYSQADLNEIVTKLLNFMGEINWDKDGFEDMEKIDTDSSVFSPLYESIALIKHDVDILMKEKEFALNTILKNEERLAQAEKMKAVGQLAGGIAHDFNNMLCSIAGLSEILMLRYKDKDPLIEKYSKMIKDTTDRAAALTSKLLAYARKGKFEKVPQDIHIIITETLKLVSHSLNKNIKLSSNFYNGSPQVIGDSSQLLNMIMNLAINAGDAMANGGEFSITTEFVKIEEDACISNYFNIHAGDYVKIKLEDNGTGICTENIKKIFEPFFTTKAVGKGTGLGLASVFGTVESHGGSVSVFSIVDKGTTFELLLPLTQETKKYTPTRSISAVLKNANIIAYNHEDESLFTTTEMIKELGYKTISVVDISLLFNKLENSLEKIDAVVLNYDPYDLNEFDSIKKLSNEYSDIQIIILSDYLEDELLGRLHNLGISSFIQKPYTIIDLSVAFVEALPHLYK